MTTIGKLEVECGIEHLHVHDGKLIREDGTTVRMAVPRDRREGESVLVPTVRFREGAPICAAIPLTDL